MPAALLATLAIAATLAADPTAASSDILAESTPNAAVSLLAADSETAALDALLKTTATPAAEPDGSPDAVALQTAVALNYCRTALHRIRTHPTADVLVEERDRVLDNLSMDGIADPEVITLYSALLDEIGQIQVASAQQRLVESETSRAIRRKVVWDSVAFASQVATAQYAAAIRTGADSWWDVRDRSDRKTAELLRIQRERMASVTKKSSLFLDTFWTLARRRNIPDAWLVRGGDLQRLESAVGEDNDDVRLRRLQRLQPYLVAYPPYWYHLGRTQQALGRTDDAIATYERLARLEDGQFRIDEMLAAAEVNWALLLDEKGDPAAPLIAARGLRRAPHVWQANLAAAGIFERAGRIADAEDALLRNIDAGRAVATSQTFRLAMLARSGERSRLAELLADPQTVAAVPSPALLRCAIALDDEKARPVADRLSRSIAAYPRSGLTSDELILTADAGWNLPAARFRFPTGSAETPQPEFATVSGGHAARFSRIDLPDEELSVELSYPDGTQMVVTFRRAGRRSLRPVMTLAGARIGERLLSFDAAGIPRHASLPPEWEIR